MFLSLYTCLFNVVLDSGILPDSWLIGKIQPILKNKGDPLFPENYRPITVSSCTGKRFTSILNNRLTSFLDENEMLSETQTGFRKDYSTLANIFFHYTALENFLKHKRRNYFAVSLIFQGHLIQYGGWAYGKNYK